MNIVSNLPAAYGQRRVRTDESLGFLDYGSGGRCKQSGASQYGADAHGKFFTFQHAGVDHNNIGNVIEHARKAVVHVVRADNDRSPGNTFHSPQ